MEKVAVAVTSQVNLITSIVYLEKQYGSIDSIDLVLIIAHEQMTDDQVILISNIAKTVFSIEKIVDIRDALETYKKYRGLIKENLFRYRRLSIIKKELDLVLGKYFNELKNVDLLLIRKPSRFQEMLLIKCVDFSLLSRIEDGANAIISPYIPIYYRCIAYIKKIPGAFLFLFYRLAWCGDEMTFIYKNYNLPKVCSIHDGSIDADLLLKNFKKIKQPIDSDKFKKIKLLFLGTYNISKAESSFEAVKKDYIALELLKKKFLLSNNEILYKPHPKTFINMAFDDYRDNINVCIASKKESLMMAEYLSTYMGSLKWVVSGAGSYSLFVISSMLEKVEPIMIRYKDNSHAKKQYDAAIKKYIEVNKVESIVV